MNSFYKVLGISKQSFHQHENRWIQMQSSQKELLRIVYEIREDHPTMGLRDMYYKLQPECMGRDAFEEFCKSENLSRVRYRNYRKTTDSSGVVRFENLLINLEITRINQVWQSDITYYELGDRFYYITFIIDAYSRLIVGHNTSQRLKTEHTTLPALVNALNNRKMQRLSVSGLIFHSDGGGQYFDKEFLALTYKNEIINSMCEYPWENGKAERVNGVIKNNYLIHRSIKSFNDLIREVDRSVKLYNTQKPHISLKRMTPINFEKKNYICNGQNADSKKSAIKLNPLPVGDNSPTGYGQNTSSSNIALKYVEN
jgi:transposase InsO family protein